MSDILMFFVEYLKKIYDKDVSVKSRRKLYEDNDDFSDGFNQVYVEKTLYRLIQQRKIVLEPCFFREKEYFLLTQKNLREIYKDSLVILMSVQEFWRGIKQYKDEYDLHGPKQRRLQGYKVNRARGILLTMDFLIFLMNNYVENTHDFVDATEEQDSDNTENLEDIANRESNPNYRIFKENVLFRDNYKCQCCGLEKKLQVHHIFSSKYYPSLKNDVNNGITLCKYCHQKYHTIYRNKHNVNAETFSKFMRDFGIR